MRENFLSLVCVGVLAFGAVPIASNAQPITWGDNGHQYEFVITPSRSTWGEANSHLTATLGSDWYLATITSQAEQDWIISNILDFLGIQDGYWLGGYQPQDELRPSEGWQWVTGETWNYTNWMPGEPSDAWWANLGPEQYLSIAGGQHIYYGHWNDAIYNPATSVYSYANGYIAESNGSPVPEPATMLLLGTGIAGLVGTRLKSKKS